MHVNWRIGGNGLWVSLLRRLSHQLLCFSIASDGLKIWVQSKVTSFVNFTHYSACCSLEDPVSGQVELFNTTLGSTANYTCNHGYSLSNGSSTRTCEADGEWSGSPPSCEREYTCHHKQSIHVLSIADYCSGHALDIGTHTSIAFRYLSTMVHHWISSLWHLSASHA